MAPPNLFRSEDFELSLPPRHRSDKRPTLVLDLDETLVHSCLKRPAEYDYMVRWGERGVGVAEVEGRCSGIT